ncbi:MAG TPA: lactonase family protein [Arachidicoccus sp.]|nr:lactonase family protein [Arachidicoccus sp.]
MMSATSLTGSFYLFVGTYNSGEKKGIYVYRINRATRMVKMVSYVAIDNPSYLCFAPGGQFLYATNETSGKPEVSAFKFDLNSEQLIFINKQDSGGEAPCFVSVDQSGKWLFSGNYNGGNLSAFPINSDGSISPYVQRIQHTGHGIHPTRQLKSHVHSVVVSPDQAFLYCADLGMDRIISYPIIPTGEQPLDPTGGMSIEVTAGSGPRHIVFHPRLPYAYMIAELAGTVSVYQKKDGRLTLIQMNEIPLDDQSADRGSADIQLSPDGRFLYASTRGKSNCIAIYGVDETDGKLRFIGLPSTMGLSPRNFVIDPTGDYLLVANQHSDEVVIFQRDEKSGLLALRGEKIVVSSPACLKILPIN